VISQGAILSFGTDGRSGGVDILNGASFSGTGQLLIAAGNPTSGAGVRLVGNSSHAGLVKVTHGTFNVNGGFEVATYEQTGGVIGGIGTFTVNGSATLSGGVQADPGISQFNGDVILSGNGSRGLFNDRVMNTAGTTTWSGNTAGGGNALTIANGGTINNTGTWNDANSFDSSIGSGSGAFNNFGNYNKIGSTTTSVNAAFTNSGRLSVAAGAVFEVNSTVFTNTGTVSGSGTVRTATNGTLNSSGVISPGFSVGDLTIDGDLSMAGSGVLDIELAGLTSFDRLFITDDASFAGGLNVISLGYMPTVGDSFVIVTFDRRLASSTFGQLTWTGFGPEVVFEAEYNLRDVTLRVTAVPEPGTWALWLTGIVALGAVVRRRKQSMS